MPRRSVLYAAGKGKVARISRTSESPRRHAGGIRAWSGAHKRGGQPDYGKVGKWQPKRSRRKLGARRKVTLIQQLFTWIKVPGKVRRRTRRRR